MKYQKALGDPATKSGKILTPSEIEFYLNFKENREKIKTEKKVNLA